MLNDALAVKLIHEGKYQSRKSDLELATACGMTLKEWDKYTVDNFQAVLTSSYHTALVRNLIPYTNRTRDIQTPGEGDTKRLTLNFPYPHQISNDEFKALRDIFTYLYGDYFESISITHIPHDKLEYDYVAKGYTDYFCYNWTAWLKKIHEVDMKDFHPSLKLWFPSIYHGDMSKLTPEQKQLEKTAGFFNLTAMVHMLAGEIQWVPIEELVDQRIGLVPDNGQDEETT